MRLIISKICGARHPALKGSTLVSHALYNHMVVLGKLGFGTGVAVKRSKG